MIPTITLEFRDGDRVLCPSTLDEGAVMRLVANATGWKLGTWSSGRPCLRKPCGRVASDSDIEAIVRSIVKEANRKAAELGP